LNPLPPPSGTPRPRELLLAEPGLGATRWALRPSGRRGSRAGPPDRPPKPNSAAMPCIVAGVTENWAVRLVRKGSNCAVSVPT